MATKIAVPASFTPRVQASGGQVVLRKLNMVSEILGSPLRAEHNMFECMWTARVGDFYACGLDESDAYASLYSVVVAKLNSQTANPV